MASSGWAKNKKGYLVNSQGKTARQVRQEKYAANKAEAKAKASGGGEGGGGGGASTRERDVNRNMEMASEKLAKAKKSKNPEEKRNAELLFQAAKRDKLDVLSPEKTGVGIILSSEKGKPDSFTKATVVIPVMAGNRNRNDPPTTREITGKVLGDYIVHKSTTGWTGKFQITHIKSGFAVTWQKKDIELKTEKDGQEIIRKLIKADVKMPARFTTNLSREEAGKMIADINKAVES